MLRSGIRKNKMTLGYLKIGFPPRFPAVCYGIQSMEGITHEQCITTASMAVIMRENIKDADFLLQIFKDWREYEQIHIMFWVGYEQPRFVSILGMRKTLSFPEYLFRHCVPRQTLLRYNSRLHSRGHQEGSGVE
jgi:hypothetical protein